MNNEKIIKAEQINQDYRKGERVIDQLMIRCRQAYQSRKPLIFIDTDELVIINLLVERISDEKMIDLFGESPIPMDNNPRLYYEYIADRPNALKRSVNFTDRKEELSQKLDELADKGNNIHGGLLPQLIVVHMISDYSYKDFVESLRKYVQTYVTGSRDYRGIIDNASAIRSSCVLIYGDMESFPRDLIPYTEFLEVGYPREWEIREILEQAAKENEMSLDSKLALNLATQMRGFSLVRARDFANRLMWTQDKSGDPLLYNQKERDDALWIEKSQAIRSTGGILTPYREQNNDSLKYNKHSQEKTKTDENEEKKEELKKELGGMGNFIDWAVKNEKYLKAGFDTSDNDGDPSEKRGVPKMKGVLLCGVPGCGKSEAAKILYRFLNIPMLRMDVDQLMGGLVGDSERNMRQALALAEAMSPCILWIDELDKGFSSSNSSGGDGGTFKRMFGRLLTWMQENKEPCFIFATANDISLLPPEFFRSGRFNDLFSVFMPTNNECIDIFRAQMRRADKLRKDAAKEKGNPEPKDLFDEKCYDDQVLQQVMDVIASEADKDTGDGARYLSGADIEKIVCTALKNEKLDVLFSDSNPESIRSDDWKNVLIEVCKSDISTLGSGYANMNEIAACYVRLLRKNFIPVSNKGQVLFKKDNYKRNPDAKSEVKFIYDGECPSDKVYDQRLFTCLKTRIKNLASGIEEASRARLY